MIILERITKIVASGNKTRNLLSSVSMTIPTDRRIALLGPSREDNKALIGILAGNALPSSGRVIRKVRVSYPVGDLNGFDANLSIRSNIAYVARLYGADIKSTVAFVERVAKLGPALDRPARELTGIARIELGQILTFAIPFDFYLLNLEVTNHKGPKSPTLALLDARITRPVGMIATVEQPAFARERCEMGLVLHNGQLMAFADIEQALSVAKLVHEAEPAHK